MEDFIKKFFLQAPNANWYEIVSKLINRAKAFKIGTFNNDLEIDFFCFLCLRDFRGHYSNQFKFHLDKNNELTFFDFTRKNVDLLEKVIKNYSSTKEHFKQLNNKQGDLKMEKLIQEKIENLNKELQKIIPDLDMKVVDYTVNPIIRVNAKTASELLTKNTSNRKVNQSRVKFYHNEMEKGEWKLNGENLKFDNKGFMIDGQHRLNAIALLEDQSVNLELRLAVNPNDFATIDTGKSRTFADVLSILNVPNYSTVAAALKYLYLYDNKKMNFVIANSGKTKQGAFRISTSKHNSAALSNAELEEYFYKHRTIQEYVIQSKLLKTIATTSEICFLNYIFSRIDYETALYFFDKLIEGDSLESGDTIKVLRDKLQENSMNNKLRFSSKKRLGLIIKAWNLIRANKYKTKNILFNEKEEQFPYAK